MTSSLAQSSGDKKFGPTPLGAPGQPGWAQIKDRDCYVWDPQPTAGESIAWTGDCENGFATGVGTAHLFTASGAPSNQLEGKATAGKLEGEVTVTYPDGSRYVGNLDASGLRTGFGELTYSNGVIAKGVFIDGRYDGEATISYPDGRRYLGNVNASGSPSGLGTLTYPTGLNDKGFFVGGEFVGQENRDFSDIKLVIQEAAQGMKDGHIKDAEALYESEIGLLSKRIGSIHWYIANAQDTLAGLYLFDKQFDRAEELLRSSLAMFDAYFGEDNINDSLPLIALGVLYEQQHLYSDAETYYQHALRIEQRRSNVDAKNTITCLTGLGRIYQIQARYRDSERSYKQAIDTAGKISGSESVEVARILEDIASLYDVQDHYNEAESMYTRALAIMTKVYGENHYLTARILNDLAHLYLGNEDYSKAEVFYQRALSIHEHTFGEYHTSVVTDVVADVIGLAELCLAQDRYQEAEALLKRALSLDSENPNALYDLGKAYSFQGRKLDAEAILERSINSTKNLYGENDVLIPHVLDTLADMYFNDRQYSNAKTLINRSITMKTASSRQR
jgi:tetratricopeptide (TPR) repeat protein